MLVPSELERSLSVLRKLRTFQRDRQPRGAQGPARLPVDEDEITQLLLDGGLNEAGRAAFCSGTRTDCRVDAVEEAAKRQGIADLTP